MSRAERLRVAYVVKRFPRLSETFVLNECLELERQGIEIEIYSLLTPPSEPRHDLLRELKAKVIYLDAVAGPIDDGCDLDPEFEVLFTGKSPASRSKLIAKALHIARLAASSGCDHLHAHFGSDTTTVAALAARKMGVGYSFTAHAKDIYHTYVDQVTDRAVRKAKIQHADFVVTVSDYNAAHLAKIAGPDDREKIVRIYNGIDLARFAFSSENREPATILAVGRLVEKKGYADLIAAMALVRKQRPDARCIICGDGSERSQIEAQISDSGLSSAITLRGAVDQAEIIRAMRTATMLVLPAIVTESGDRDALPTVLLEAQAMGLPVVSTPVCGIPEIISDGKTGCLVPERSPEAVAAAILRLLGDEALRTRLSTAARAKAENSFDLSAAVRSLSSLFGAAASGGPRAPGRAPGPALQSVSFASLVSGV